MPVLYGLEKKSFRTPNKRLVLLVLVVFVFFVYSLLLSKDSLGILETNLSKDLRIEVINVGQGDSSIIRTPKGLTILMDGGLNISREEAKRQNRWLIQDYLASQNIKKLDAVIVTHWHSDDFSGLIPVLEEYPVEVIYETPIGFINEVYDKFNGICVTKGIRRVTVGAGDVLEFGDEVFVQVLNPEDAYTSSLHSEINDDSIVLLIRYGKVQALMCADIGEEAEREILKYNDGIKSQIIKIPDHGAERSGYRPFFKKVDADVGIVSVGAENPFGYPSDKHMDFLESTGMKLYRTDKNGTVRIRIGGGDEKDYTISVDRNI